MENDVTENTTCVIGEINTSNFNIAGSKPLYGVFLFNGTGTITIDFIEYNFSGSVALFTTPWQIMQFNLIPDTGIRSLWFHADYYCIEYHKKEVSCNGLLFNNIYSQPFIQLSEKTFQEIQALLNKLQQELELKDTYSQAVARSYLQLVLALSSRAKIVALQDKDIGEAVSHHPILKFKDLLERNYKEERTPSFYAEQLGMTTNTFSKKCKLQFHKAPSFLIQERVILEAKKLIHLSLKSMKEIATELHFDDEHYFSRYFKKHTGISPTAFRESVGIAKVAYSSI